MHRLEKLIEKFLEFARLDLLIMAPMPEALNVEKVCQEVLELLQPLVEAKGMALQALYPPEMLVISADPALFRRVLENLLDNAIKYGPPQSAVVLEIHREGQEALFAVKDQGPGIAEEDRPHLFEFFFRGADAMAEKGFGLGLATVKRVIDAHGGRIWLDPGSGHGTTVFFTFPLEQGSSPVFAEKIH